MMGSVAPCGVGARMLVGRKPPANREPSMGEITTIERGLAKACFSGARSRCGRGDGSAQAAAARTNAGVFRRAAALRDWAGGLRNGALLGARVGHAWPRGATDASAIREGLRQAQQERRGRCTSDLRGGGAADDALCARQDGRAAALCFYIAAARGWCASVRHW